MVIDVCLSLYVPFLDNLCGLVERHPPQKQEIRGLIPRFTQSGHSSDLKIGTVVDTMPGILHYQVTAKTGWPGVKDWLALVVRHPP